MSAAWKKENPERAAEYARLSLFKFATSMGNREYPKGGLVWIES
jgi:hypothetical protein